MRHSDAVVHLVSSDKICIDLSKIKDADLYIIAVSDIAIEEVSAKLPFKNKFVVHTSGSANLNLLSDQNYRGVFYPLQTFSKNKYVDFKTIPICLETERDADYDVLLQIANAITDIVYKVDSNQRKALHVAAVFACNFVNHLYKIANDICTENQITFQILYSLIKETANKIETLSPIDAQTGPAERADLATINAHIKFLSNENQQDIYKILTKSIIDNGKKL